MDNAVTYVEQVNEFISTLLKVSTTNNVELVKGRKYDRIRVNGVIKYFIDKDTTMIYGAKSAVQHNLRRQYGTTATVSQFDWETHRPISNTAIADEWYAREESIKNSYKRRGRPRKLVAP